MRNTIRLITVLPILLAFLVAGCTLDAPESPQGLAMPEGTQTFAKFGAIGNSLTAGFMDGGLMIDGQLNSFPRLIAQQIGLDASVGQSEFTQPYIAYPGIGTGTDSVSVGKLSSVLYFNGADIDYLTYTPITQLQSLAMLATLPVPYHNMAVPGAKVYDMMNTIESATNPYYTLINRASFFGSETVPAQGQIPGYETASCFRQAVAKGPTLMTVWIGNNDVLGAALSGNPTTGDITNPALFAQQYQGFLASLAGGLLERTGFPAALVVANIPSITDIAYFMPLSVFETVVGGPWPGGYAEADVQLVVFPALGWATPGNAGTPVPGNLTLTATEAQLIANTVTDYNTAIQGVIDAVNALGYARVGLMDANAALADAPTEYGPLATTHFMLALAQVGNDPTVAARATLFSLDGIHPNNIGYGYLANKFIAAINTLVGTSVQEVDLAGLTWDPGHLHPAPAPTSATAMPTIDADIAGAMRNLFE